MTQTKSIFQQPLWVTIFALTAAIAWGWAYPLIKLGLSEFAISADMTGSKMLFAGIRFCLSGLIILAIAGTKKRDFKVRKPIDWWYILLFCMMNTTLHYAFFYFGLSHSEGSRAAILNSLSVFSVVIFACIFFKSDRMTVKKIIGCIVGFAGILSLNLGGAESGKFTWLGDGMIILNALCGASASLLTRGLGKRITLLGITYLLLLIAISTLGFTLYNKLLTCNPVGKVAIYNSLIPVVGAVTSCLCLDETFYIKYMIAGALAAGGIYIINNS